MATIAPIGKYILTDGNGDPLAGGKIHTYDAGTNTPKATFTTQDESVANTNPVVLDANGFADIWLGDGGYKFVVTDASDSPLFTVDDLGGGSSAAFGGAVNNISVNTPITDIYANSFNLCTASPTLSLLPADQAGEGFYFTAVNNGVGTVTIDPDASETIAGGSTLDISPGEGAIIICDGINWQTFATVGLASLSRDNTFTGNNTFTSVLTKSNDTFITGRNAADDANVDIIKVNASDSIEIGGNVSGASTHKLVDMADPTAAQDYTTKNYVDSIKPFAAWVFFDGTGTPSINASYNVDSITDNGTGSYSVNLTTAVSSVNLCVIATAGFGSATNSPRPVIAYLEDTSTIRVFVNNASNSARQDVDLINVAIIGA